LAEHTVAFDWVIVYLLFMNFDVSIHHPHAIFFLHNISDPYKGKQKDLLNLEWLKNSPCLLLSFISTWEGGDEGGGLGIIL
jgi:hypothetical protein